MTASTPEATATITTAIVVAKGDDARGRMRPLCEILTDVGIQVAMVESAEDAAAQMLMGAPNEPLLVLVEAAGGDQATVLGRLGQTIGSLAATLPNAAPVVVGARPAPSLVIESFRAGAVDFIDLTTESHDTLSDVLRRLGERMNARMAERRRVSRMRGMVEEFLRDLIKTERRSIDLERKLEIKEHGSLELTTDLDSDREPVVVIVEDDREVADTLADALEDNGIATFAYINGEDAVEGVRKLVGKGDAIDLALVDARLPGMSGLEAISGMREHRPWLGAILMTGYDDSELAKSAADLGVVGYVLKPFDDIGGLVQRIKEQALHFRDLARDQHYLERIKKRHERVLTAYRTVAAELDRLG